jgi:carbon-monoxide dehydrogenase medium subunit
VRCPSTEAFLVGKKITEDTAEKAGKLVVDACSPISDVRASADYRRKLVQILVKRSLLEAAAKTTN